MAKKHAQDPAEFRSADSTDGRATTREMTLDVDGLMSILANSLYSEKKVFIRELVQNAHDGIRRREKREPDHHGRIDIETRADDGWISVTDNGIGMDADDLHSYLSRIGASGTKQLGRLNEQVRGLVGQFGIGFLSGFIVANRVEVRTRKLGDDQGWCAPEDGTAGCEDRIRFAAHQRISMVSRRRTVRWVSDLEGSNPTRILAFWHPHS